MFIDLLVYSKCQIKWNSGQFWTSATNIVEWKVHIIPGMTYKRIQKTGQISPNNDK